MNTSDLFHETVLAWVQHRADAPVLCAQVIEVEPDHVAARCLRGFWELFLGLNHRKPYAFLELQEAEKGWAKSSKPQSEESLIEGLRASYLGDPLLALDHLERGLKAMPCNLIFNKLIHSLCFMYGMPDRMRATLEKVLPMWTREKKGYGYILGMYAFALEETNDFELAQYFGQQALEYNPYDIWGAHAVVHIFETQNQAQEGALWLESIRNQFEHCTNLKAHLDWHLALFYLSINQIDKAVELYDNKIENFLFNDYRDLVNSVSLLFYLEKAGYDVKKRWKKIVEKIEPFQTDHGLAFADVHCILALVSAGQTKQAQTWLSSIKQHAQNYPYHESKTFHQIGIPLADAIIQIKENPLMAFDQWKQIQNHLLCLGGSYVQRGLFQRIFNSIH